MYTANGRFLSVIMFNDGLRESVGDGSDKGTSDDDDDGGDVDDSLS